jgi:hypothetical protein
VLELDGSSFTVHESVICAIAPFFKAALRREWEEGKERMIKFPDTDAEVFETYVHWTYSGTVDAAAISPPSEAVVEPRLPSYLAMGKLWIFADKVLDFELCNRLSDLILDKAREEQVRVSLSSLEYLWPRISEDSPLRKLHIDLRVELIDATDFDPAGPNYTQGRFWQDYLTADATEETKVNLMDFFIASFAAFIIYAKDSTHDSLFDEDWDIRPGVRCRYHRHEDGKTCED